MVVAGCALRMAPSLHADPEIVELAAYLHDLSAVYDPGTLPDHAKSSAGLAGRLLAERDYPAGKLAGVATAITLHSAPLQIGAAPPEAVCLSNADAVARILRPAYWLYFAFRIRNEPFEKGRRWLRALLEAQWRDMVEPAKDMVRSQFATVLDLLRE